MQMDKVRFGKSELLVSKIAFGAIPIQRLNTADAVAVVRGVIDLGVNFIDTANGYTDSEEKIGIAIKDIPRDNLIITTKSGARDKKTYLEHIDLSLKQLGTDYIDLHQMHGVSSPGCYDAVFGEGGAYEGLMEAVRAGKVRFPAFSSHSVPMAIQMMREHDFAAVQLPFNYIDTEALAEAIPLAKELDMGFIAMKPLGGGLLSDAGLSFRYLAQFDSIIPDPGIEKLSEMEEIVRISEVNEPFTAADAAAVERAKAEMGSSWCHRCEYCRPCPQNIAISMALNTTSFMKRLPPWRSIEMAGQVMENARNCTACRVCVERCPYKLDVPVLLKERLEKWDRFVAENRKVTDNG
jgi:predicted aldo/keto reductase-like oxidoreductase